MTSPSFYIDKYMPVSIYDLSYNVNLNNILETLSTCPDFPNLIFYGPEGAGKKTRLRILLKLIFGDDVTHTKIEQREIKHNSKTINFTITSSKFHIELTPSDALQNDKIIVQTVIKEMASNKNNLISNDISNKHDFQAKIVIINEADRLTKDAQFALRRTMEKFSVNCKFILCANYISKLIPALRSRCVAIRVASPKESDIQNVLRTIKEKEDLSISEESIKSISENTERNLRKAINFFQLCKYYLTNI